MIRRDMKDEESRGRNDPTVKYLVWERHDSTMQVSGHGLTVDRVEVVGNWFT